jgi:hypothetical protein
MDRDLIERALRLARGGFAYGGDAELQSNSMPVFSNGQVNWGDSDSAADFARADAAMRAMRSAPAAPEARDAPMPVPRPAPVRAPYSAPRDVPLPPVRPANLGQPVFQNSIPEGPGAYIPGDGFPARPPGQYGDPASLDPNMMARGFTSPMSPPQPAPSVSMGYSDVSPLLGASELKAPSFGAMESITPGTPEWPRAPSRPAEGKFTNRVMPLTPPAQPGPTTDELLSLLPVPPKADASAAIEKAAPAAFTTDQLLSQLPGAAPAAPARAVPNMTPQQRDLIIRTIAAEASGKSPEEAQAIGHVIMNRITSGRYGKTPEKVLFAPNQFEPWSDPRGSNYPMRHKPGTAKYEKAQAALDAALANDDLTGGATLFWGPKSQAALGRPAPRWGRTGGIDIGDTRFHREHGGPVYREHHADGDPVGDNQDYSNGARPLTIYRGERPEAPAGSVETRGPDAHSRFRAGLGQIGRFEDVPPMDPAVMGENWANAVRRLRENPIDPDAPTMSARTPSGREWLYDAIIGSPENGTIQNNRANIAGLLAGSQGTGMGVLDFVPGIGSGLNATDMAHSINEGDYVGAGVSGAMMAAAPFIGKLAKPAMNLGRKAVDLAKSVSDDTLNYLVPRAMGAAGAAGILSPTDAEAGKLQKVINPIRALHSSPHEFSKFDLSKIGTGEGNQMFGHGLYFAENPKVSGQGGEYWTQFFNKMKPGPEFSAAAALYTNKFDREKAIASLLRGRDYHAQYGRPGKSGQGADYELGARLLAQQDDEAAQMLLQGKIAGPKTYEVDIHANPDRLLNWDKKMDEQSPDVRKALSNFDIFRANDRAHSNYNDALERALTSDAGAYVPPLPPMPRDYTGKQIHSALRDQLHLTRQPPAPFLQSSADLSAQMNKRGIQGIKYLDGRSRLGEGDPTHNYVIFDDKLLDIVRRYAKGGEIE